MEGEEPLGMLQPRKEQEVQAPPRGAAARRRLRWRSLASALTAFTRASAPGLNEDEETARAALDYLFRESVTPARQFLARRFEVRDESLAADLVQGVFVRLWERRATLRFDSQAAWFAFLQTALRNAFIDRVVRPRDGTAPGGDAAETAAEAAGDSGADAARSLVAALLDAAEAGALRTLADRVFLEIDAAVPDEEMDRRLLAAQMFYLDGVPWNVVLRRLGPARRLAGSGAALSREALDAWIADPGTLRRLAYHALYYENDRLALFLMDAPDGAGTAALDALARRAESACAGRAAGEPAEWGGGRWTWAEALVLLWRCRNALLREQILARNDCPLDAAGVDALSARLRDALPFRGEMEALVQRLGEDRARASCGHIGLWQRLALQYRLFDDLPHRDILDRTAPAAAVVDYPLNLGRLNVWLSNGRLQARLARYAARRDGEEAEEEAGRQPAGGRR